MPADPSITSTPSVHHTEGTAPYRCSQGKHPPARADWSIDYPYCRTSLDHHPTGHKVGSADPRCPVTCAHKAPEVVAVRFTKLFGWCGAGAAAKLIRGQKEAA